MPTRAPTSTMTSGVEIDYSDVNPGIAASIKNNPRPSGRELNVEMHFFCARRRARARS